MKNIESETKMMIRRSKKDLEIYCEDIKKI